MSEIIGVDPGKLLGLQRDVAERFRIALEKGDPDIPNAIEALLKATPGRRKLFTSGHLFRSSSAITVRMDRRPEESWNKVVDHDPRSRRIKEIDWMKVRFDSFVKPDQGPITGEEKLAILKENGCIRLDDSWAYGLEEDYVENRGDSILEYLEKKGIKRIDFFGTITDYVGCRGELPPGRMVTSLFIESNGWRRMSNYMKYLFDHRSFTPIVQASK